MLEILTDLKVRFEANICQVRDPFKVFSGEISTVGIIQTMQ